MTDVAGSFLRRSLAFLGLGLILCAGLHFTPLLHAAPPLEFCGDRPPDQQLGAAPGRGAASPGCTPLVEKKTGKEETSIKAAGPRRKMNVDDLQSEVARFLKEYRRFLECCRTDLSELETVEELGDQVTELLRVAQTGLFSEQLKVRGFTFRELLPPVAKARADLHALRARLEQLEEARNRLPSLDYEAAGKEAQVIQELEESIRNEFQTPRLSGGPKTGTAIGVSPSAGPAIGRTPKAGPAIGSEGLAGSSVGVTPKTGRDIGVTGPTGFEIGGTGKAGPSIGESTLNTEESAVGSSLAPSSVGSTLPDSTVGSSLGRSSIGSTLPDSTVGSSLGGPPAGHGAER